MFACYADFINHQGGLGDGDDEYADPPVDELHPPSDNMCWRVVSPSLQLLILLPRLHDDEDGEGLIIDLGYEGEA